MTVLRNNNTANVMMNAARAALEGMKPAKDNWGSDEEIYLGNLGLIITLIGGPVFESVTKVGDVDEHGVIEIEYGGHVGSHRALIAADEVAAVSFVKDPY